MVTSMQRCAAMCSTGRFRFTPLPCVCQDTVLASAYAKARTLRLADGPDEVPLGTIAKLEMSRYL